jgi:hypothetical protein
MGCCLSRSSGPNSPYPDGGPNNSSRAINPPPLTLPESAQPQSGGTNAPESPRRRRRDQRPLGQHIDKPLRRHVWTSKGRTWTKGELAHERRDFFDTRVTGRLEVWQTIHAALQVLWDPTGQEDDGSAGLNMAQTILSAAEVSLPTGDLANGVYDSLGNYYPLPEWIVCDPTNVIDDGDANGELSNSPDDVTGDDDDDLDGDDAESRREEKGKGVIDVREQVALRARLSENGRDYQVSVTTADSVRSIAKKIAEQASIPSAKKVRIAYMGRILRENTTLEAQHWEEGHTINAFVFDR